MDENDPKPMTDHDVTPPPAGAGFEPTAPLKDAGVGFTPETDATSAPAPASVSVGEGKTGVDKISRQAGDRALAFVGQGKDRATDALDQIVQALTDAAQQVDDKLGSQYGQYAHTAAGNVRQFADQLRAKDPDDLVDDARAFIRKSPGVAVGAAAVIGFALARLASAGLDQRSA